MTLRESDSTCYDLPKHVGGQHPVEKSTTMQRVNKTMRRHPVWTGVLSGVMVASTGFAGVWLLTQHNGTLTQPYIDKMQDVDRQTIRDQVAKHSAVLTSMQIQQQQIRIIVERIAAKLNVDTRVHNNGN